MEEEKSEIGKIIDGLKEAPKVARLYRIQFRQPLPVWFMGEIWKQLPQDTMLRSCGHDVRNDLNCLIVESEKFPVVEEGKQVPELGAVFNVLSQEVSLMVYNAEKNDYETISWEKENAPNT